MHFVKTEWGNYVKLKSTNNCSGERWEFRGGDTKSNLNDMLSLRMQSYWAGTLRKSQVSGDREKEQLHALGK